MAVRADVNIDFRAGTLIVGPLPEASADLIAANYFGRRGRTNIRRTGDTAIVDVTMDGRNFFRHFYNVRWELALSSTPQISFDLDGGAADLDANIGAADISIVLPETGTVRADIRRGAAEINIRIPEGVAARITNNSSLSSVDIDTDRFPKFDRVYESPDFDTADNRVI